jgi:hypothetical protein
MPWDEILRDSGRFGSFADAGLRRKNHGAVAAFFPRSGLDRANVCSSMDNFLSASAAAPA